MEVRPGAADDLPSIVGILNHYVLNTNARFDTAPLTPADRADWFAGFRTVGPHRLFVVDAGGADGVAGFACSQPYRPGPAFAETVEVSVYLRPATGARGLGSRLYEALFAALAEGPAHRAVAGIALPNDASIALHRKFGFEEVGVFDEYAKKHGRYISSLWMQKRL